MAIQNPANINPRKWLVTGGAGFVGSYLVGDIAADPDNSVLVIDRDVDGGKVQMGQEGNILYEEYGLENVSRFEGSLTAFRPDVIVHLAARSRVIDCEGGGKQAAIDTNVYGTATVLRLAQKHAVPRVLFASSSAVYGGRDMQLPDGATGKTPEQPEWNGFKETDRLAPVNHYGLTKEAGERLVDLHNRLGMSACSLRLFNVFGDGGSGVADTFLKAKLAKDKYAGGMRTAFHGLLNPTNVKRDFVYVGDVVRAIRLVAPLLVLREPINVGTGESLHVSDVAKLLDLPLTPAEPPHYLEPKETKADSSGLRRLGWNPTVTLAAYFDHKREKAKGGTPATQATN